MVELIKHDINSISKVLMHGDNFQNGNDCMQVCINCVSIRLTKNCGFKYTARIQLGCSSETSFMGEAKVIFCSLGKISFWDGHWSQKMWIHVAS